MALGGTVGQAFALLVKADGSVLVVGTATGGATTAVTGTVARKAGLSATANAVTADNYDATSFVLGIDGTGYAWGVNQVSPLVGTLNTPSGVKIPQSALGIAADNPAIVDTPVTLAGLSNVIELRAEDGVLLAMSEGGAVTLIPGTQVYDSSTGKLTVTPLTVQGLAPAAYLGAPVVDSGSGTFPIVDSNGAVVILDMKIAVATTSGTQTTLTPSYTLTTIPGLPAISRAECAADGSAFGAFGIGAPSVGNGTFCLALARDGSVWGWGSNAYGQLADGTTVSRTTVAKIAGLPGAQEIAAGPYNGYALSYTGDVYAWGNPAYVGRSSAGTVPVTTPTQVPGLAGIEEIVAGGWVSSDVLVEDGNGAVLGWGGDLPRWLSLTSAVETPTALTGINLH